VVTIMECMVDSQLSRARTNYMYHIKSWGSTYICVMLNPLMPTLYLAICRSDLYERPTCYLITKTYIYLAMSINKSLFCWAQNVSA